MTITREQATEIAIRCAKAKPNHNYIVDPFEPHEWVIDAIMQASAVPEGFAIVPKSMQIDVDALRALEFTCGGDRDSDDESEDWLGGTLWIGHIMLDEDNNNVVKHGLHVYCDEYPKEGSVTLAEFEPWN